jgi:hypothetical protein
MRFCPHLGVDLSHAEIEECDNPFLPSVLGSWHRCVYIHTSHSRRVFGLIDRRYDFDLRTGKSDTGLTACTYTAKDTTTRMASLPQILPLTGGSSSFALFRKERIHMSKSHRSSPNFCLSNRICRSICCRAAFDHTHAPLHGTKRGKGRRPEDPPTTLMEWAVLILNTLHPTLKVENHFVTQGTYSTHRLNATRHAVQLYRTGKLASIGHESFPTQYTSSRRAVREKCRRPRKNCVTEEKAGMLHR